MFKELATPPRFPTSNSRHDQLSNTMKGLEITLPTYTTRNNKLMSDASTDVSDTQPSELMAALDSVDPPHRTEPEAASAAAKEVGVASGIASRTARLRSWCRRIRFWPSRFHMPSARALAFVIMPVLVLLLTAGVAYLKWRDVQEQRAHTAAVQAVPAATETAIAILSYQPDTAEKELTAARDRLTGDFRDEYTKLITDTVIPGAKEKRIAVTAKSPAAGLVSATAEKAVVLVYIDQTTIIGTGAPTDTASSVRVTLDKEGDKWLVSKFDPI